MNDTTETILVIAFITCGLSLLTSVVVDVAVDLCKLRGVLLLRAIRQLHAEDNAEFSAFRAHPLYQAQLPPSTRVTKTLGRGFTNGWPRVPSELSGEVFASIVLDNAIAAAGAPPPAGSSPGGLLKLWAAANKGPIRAVLREEFYQATADFASAHTRTARLFDQQMERCKGWFKRRVWFVNFVVGFIIALILNADYWSIRALLQQQLEAKTLAVKNLRDIQSGAAPVVTTGKPNPTGGAAAVVTPNDDRAKLANALQAAIAKDNQADADAAQKALADFDAKHSSTPTPSSNATSSPSSSSLNETVVVSWVTLWADDLIPLGWRNDSAPRIGPQRGFVLKEAFPGWGLLTSPTKLGHLILTALLLSLGAPFWYNLVNRLLALRPKTRP